MTGIQCDSGFDGATTPKETNEYCVYPSGNKQARKLVRYTKIGDAVAYDEPQCILDEGIPGALLSYDIYDEILYQLLSETYTPVALAPENAAHLLNFGAMKVKTGTWQQEKQDPKLTFSRDVHPEVLLQRILSSPRDIGDAVLYLLDQKRRGADKDVVNFLVRKASVYLQRTTLDRNLRDDVVKKMDVFRQIERDAPDIEGLRAASLLVDSDGKALEAMSRSITTYSK